MSQLPHFIAQYSDRDKRILNEFLEVIINYNIDVVTSREQFIQQAKKYLVKYEDSQLPFHWFTNTFLKNAIAYLSYSDLYGHPFYQFMEQVLRGRKNVTGMRELVGKKTPLNAIDWEKVQYTAVRLTRPVSTTELTILDILANTSYNLYKEGFEPKHLRKKMLYTGYSTSKKFIRLTNLLELRWRILFHLPAFGLERIIIKTHLMQEKSNITELLGLNASMNSVLTTSSIYKDRRYPHTYIGILIIPDYCVVDFKRYLKKLEEKKVMKLEYLDRIVQTQVSLSFSRYKANNGWKNPTLNEKKELEMRLRAKKTRRPKTPLKFYLTDELGSEWNYMQDSRNDDIITQFCRISRVLSYQDLLKISKKEKETISAFYQKKVSSEVFYSMRMLDEYSLDEYWVKLSKKISFYKVARILEYLPMTTIFTTEKSYYLWTKLQKDDIGLLKIIRAELSNIAGGKQPSKLEVSFFDKKRNKWKKPAILTV